MDCGLGGGGRAMHSGVQAPAAQCWEQSAESKWGELLTEKERQEGVLPKADSQANVNSRKQLASQPQGGCGEGVCICMCVCGGRLVQPCGGSLTNRKPRPAVAHLVKYT